jgi:hypothetical protein
MTEKTTDFSKVVESVSAVKKLTLFNKRIQQKTVKVSNQSKPKEVKRYLKTMTKSKFRGDSESKEDHHVKLGEIMKKMHQLIEAGKAFSKEAEGSIDTLARLRSGNYKDKGSEESHREKIKKDYLTFLETRERAIEKAEESGLSGKHTKPIKHVALMHHDEFWGTRQQLRSGKVVGDMMGGLDPVFGVLLNPTGNHFTDKTVFLFSCCLIQS